MYRSKHVEPSINFEIINSITKLHLVGISTESSTMHGSMNIKFSVQIFELSHISEDLLAMFSVPLSVILFTGHENTLILGSTYI